MEKILYKTGKDQMMLRCVNTGEAKRILEEVHERTCGSHASECMTITRLCWPDITVNYGHRLYRVCPKMSYAKCHSGFV